MSQLKAPLLSYTEITFFNQLVFDTPLLCHFISHTEIVRAAYQAYILCDTNTVLFCLYLQNWTDNERVELSISCKLLDWQITFFVFSRVNQYVVPNLPYDSQ